MNNGRTWTIIVLSAVAAVITLVVSVNLVVDAYGILRQDFTRQFQVPNLNYIKIEYLSRHKDKYDSFIFGSSRPEKIDPGHIRNGRYYNLTYAIGVPQEHLANLKYLLKNGVVIKNILLGLDDFSFRLDPRERQSNLDLQPHPAVSGKDLQTFYAEYFLKLRKIGPQLTAFVRHNITRRGNPEETRYKYDLFGTGRILCPACDEEIETNPQVFTRDERYATPGAWVHGDNFQPSIDAVREFVDIARANNIRLTVFINPLHKFTYLEAQLDRFALFKKELAMITDYWDFSGINSVTINNYNYYESSHYRPFVGDMMLKVMFGAPNVKVPADFGFHVTAGNIDSHLGRLCFEVRNYMAKTNIKSANSAYAQSCGG